MIVEDLNDTSAMARKTWTIASDMKLTYDLLSPALAKQVKMPPVEQVADLRLRGNVILAKADPVSLVTLWISLDGTTVKPGKMIYDEEYVKGFYQDRIDIELSICRKDSKGHWVPIPEMKLMSEGPQTYNGTGSTSSSVSVSFSKGGNIGFFGVTPTGGANFGTSVGESHSFSRSLQDFVVEADSSGTQARHSYRMNQSIGSSYDKPTDLIQHIGQSRSASEAFWPRVYSPPPLALHDFPVISQAVWQAVNADMIDEDASLCIYVTQHVYIVEGGSRNGIVPRYTVLSGHAGTWLHAEPVPFAELKKMAGAIL